MNLQTAFGEELRELRQQQGFSQENLALECELDRTFISLLERGKRQPTLETLFKLAEALNAAPSEIIAKVEARMG
jgi:transcriptional regulator with XRE-family HTH domain